MPVLRATNVSMFAERWRNWRHAPVKKPLPSQKTRGVASSHVTHGDPCTVHEEHPDDEQRHGQRQCGRDAAFQRPIAGVVLALGLSGGIRQIDHQIVPRVADRLPQPFGSGRSRVVLHGDGRCGVVHRSTPDSRLLAERPSHTGGARSAAHTEHGKNAFCHGFVRCHDSVFFVGTKITRPPGGRVTKFGISFTRFGQNGPNGPRKIRKTGGGGCRACRKEAGRAVRMKPETFGHTRSSGRRTAALCCRKRLGVIPVTLLNCALR